MSEHPAEKGAPSARFVCPTCGASALVQADVAAQWCRACRTPMTRAIPPAENETRCRVCGQDLDTFPCPVSWDSEHRPRHDEQKPPKL